MSARATAPCVKTVFRVAVIGLLVPSGVMSLNGPLRDTGPVSRRVGLARSSLQGSNLRCRRHSAMRARSSA
jgi:hypothetical protein